MLIALLVAGYLIVGLGASTVIAYFEDIDDDSLVPMTAGVTLIWPLLIPILGTAAIIEGARDKGRKRRERIRRGPTLWDEKMAAKDETILKLEEKIAVLEEKTGCR